MSHLADEIIGAPVATPARHPGRWLRVAVVLLAAALLGGTAAPPAARAEDAAPAPAASPSASPEPGATAPPSPAPDPTLPPPPSPDPTPAPDPAPTPSQDPLPTAEPDPTPVVVSRTVYRSGAVVRQYTNYWCVPASVQTMANLVLGTSDTSYATQKLLASVTYRFNRYRYGDPSRGNDIRGWAGALNWRLPDTLPVVYRDRSYTSRQAALHAIVDAIDETGYPVGITVWHGGHAWAVVGYRVRQVPGDRSTREFLGFYVVGPLGSPRDPWPVRLMGIDGFLDQYTRYYEHREREPWHNDYVLVRPERTTTSAGDWDRP